jgi:hypothetical protein
MEELLQDRVGLRDVEESVFENYWLDNGVAVLLVLEGALLVACVAENTVLVSLIVPIQKRLSLASTTGNHKTKGSGASCETEGFIGIHFYFI